MPNLYIIAGPNGAGKTTAAKTILPDVLGIKEFVNADEIAKGLSPFNPEGVAFEAGRIMLRRIDQLLNEKADFAFETTLSSKNNFRLVEQARASGYKVVLIFFWLFSYKAAIKRVAKRVSEGGHNIPSDVVQRRYFKGVANIPAFIAIVDKWFVYNNSKYPSRIIAKGEFEKQTEVYNFDIWQSIKP